MEGFLVATAVVALVWWLSKKKGATPAPEDEMPPEPEGESNVDDPPTTRIDPPSATTPEDRVKDKLRDAGDKLKGWLDLEPPPPPAFIEVPPPAQEPTPGMSPTNPIPWDALYPGFEGYFQITEGASLSKCAQKLGIGGTNWRQVRDDPENDWAVDQCPSKYRKQPYVVINGEQNIALIPRYGKTPPEDCAEGAPGWEATLYGSYTGQHCVLHWGGGPL